MLFDYKNGSFQLYRFDKTVIAHQNQTAQFLSEQCVDQLFCCTLEMPSEISCTWPRQSQGRILGSGKSRCALSAPDHNPDGW